MIVALFGWLVALAHAQHHALVVIDVTYPGAPRSLELPVEEVALLVDTLKAAGFDVTLLRDPTVLELQEAATTLGVRLKRARRKGGTGLVYVFGYAVSPAMEGEPRLLPARTWAESRAEGVAAGMPISDWTDRMRLHKAGPVVFVWETPQAQGLQASMAGLPVVPDTALVHVAYPTGGRRGVPRPFLLALAERLRAGPRGAVAVLQGAVERYTAEEAAAPEGVHLQHSLGEDVCLGVCVP